MSDVQPKPSPYKTKYILRHELEHLRYMENHRASNLEDVTKARIRFLLLRQSIDVYFTCQRWGKKGPDPTDIDHQTDAYELMKRMMQDQREHIEGLGFTIDFQGPEATKGEIPVAITLSRPWHKDEEDVRLIEFHESMHY